MWPTYVWLNGECAKGDTIQIGIRISLFDTSSMYERTNKHETDFECETRMAPYCTRTFEYRRMNCIYCVSAQHLHTGWIHPACGKLFHFFFFQLLNAMWLSYGFQLSARGEMYAFHRISSRICIVFGVCSFYHSFNLKASNEILWHFVRIILSFEEIGEIYWIEPQSKSSTWPHP